MKNEFVTLIKLVVTLIEFSKEFEMKNEFVLQIRNVILAYVPYVVNVICVICVTYNYIKKLLDKNLTISDAIISLNEGKAYEEILNPSSFHALSKYNYYFYTLLDAAKNKEITLLGINSISKKLEPIPQRLLNAKSIKDIYENVSSIKIYCENKEEYYTDLRIQKKKFYEFCKKIKKIVKSMLGLK